MRIGPQLLPTARGGSPSATPVDVCRDSAAQPEPDSRRGEAHTSVAGDSWQGTAACNRAPHSVAACHRQALQAARFRTERFPRGVLPRGRCPYAGARDGLAPAGRRRRSIRVRGTVRSPGSRSSMSRVPRQKAPCPPRPRRTVSAAPRAARPGLPLPAAPWPPRGAELPRPAPIRRLGRGSRSGRRRRPVGRACSPNQARAVLQGAEIRDAAQTLAQALSPMLMLLHIRLPESTLERIQRLGPGPGVVDRPECEQGAERHV